MIGFKIDEVMSGTHRFESDGVERQMEFNICWGPDDIIKWANPMSDTCLTQNLVGTVSIGGLCDREKCFGILELLYFSSAKIRYTFSFVINNKPYLYIGEKVNIKPWNLHKSHTTCYGKLWEGNDLISQSVTYFKLSTLPSFLRSFRITR